MDPFAEEAGLAPDIKTKLYDMLAEKDYSIQEIYSGEIKKEDREQEIEDIDKKYDELISELLDDNYDLS